MAASFPLRAPWDRTRAVAQGRTLRQCPHRAAQDLAMLLTEGQRSEDRRGCAECPSCWVGAARKAPINI